MVFADGSTRRRRRRRQRPRRARRPCCGCCATTRSLARLRHRIPNIHYDRGQLWWANLALHEPPDYGGDAGPQPRLYWGPKDPDYFASRYQAEIYVNGFASRPFALSSVDTLWDPSRAPEGKHLVGVEEFAAPRRLFSELGGAEGALHRPPAGRVGAVRAEHDPRQRHRAARLRPGRDRAQAPGHARGRLLVRLDDGVAGRPLPPRPGAVGLPDAARQPLQLLGQHALGLRDRARLARTTASTRSPPTSGSSASSRSPDEGARHRRRARPRPRVRRGAGRARRRRARRRHRRWVRRDARGRLRGRGGGGRAPLRRPRRARQQRRDRRRHPRPGARDPQRRVGPGDGRQRQGHVADDPRRDRRDGRRRLDRQPRVRDRLLGLAPHDPLRREQGRGDRSHARVRARARPGRHPRQRDRARATPTPRAAAGSATRTPTTSPPPRSAASRSRTTWSARCSTCSTRAAPSSPARSCSSTAGA